MSEIIETETEKSVAEQIISPKVIATAVTALALSGILGAIDAITPDLFDSLGRWGGVVYGAIVSVGATLAGYVKRDPLRDSQK